jgi:hypothetical protein
MTMKRGPFKAGETAERPGQYRETGPRGGKGREVTMPAGHTLPPTTGKKRTYKLVDPSKNKAGKGK